MNELTEWLYVNTGKNWIYIRKGLLGREINVFFTLIKVVVFTRCPQFSLKKRHFLPLKAELMNTFKWIYPGRLAEITITVRFGYVKLLLLQERKEASKHSDLSSRERRAAVPNVAPDNVTLHLCLSDSYLSLLLFLPFSLFCFPLSSLFSISPPWSSFDHHLYINWWRLSW